MAFAMTVIAFIIAIAMIASGAFWLALGGVILFIFEAINVYQWVTAIAAADTAEEFDKANFGQFIVSFLAAVPISAIVRLFGVPIAWLLTTFA